MGYTSRQSASSADSIDTYDALALGPGTYSASASLSCNDFLHATLLAVKGAGPLVQSAASASASGSFSSVSLAFTNPNTAGNCIIVSLDFAASFVVVSATCMDSNGNTYPEIQFDHVPGGGVFAGTFVAFGIAAGANTVTINLTGAGTPGGAIAIAISEYAGGTAVDSFDHEFLIGAGTVSLSVPTTAAGDLLYLGISISHACAGSPFDVVGPIPQGWLVTNEPSLGFQDRTGYLSKKANNGHEWTLELRERGSATIPLWIPAGDSYTPTRLMPVYLYDETVPDGYVLEWSGLIQDFEWHMVDRAGNREATITAVSWESVMDTIYCEPMQFVNQTCGFILTTLFNAFENGSPISLGVIQAGATVPLFNVNKGDKLSDIADQLATTSSFTWNIPCATQQLFFGDPNSVASPFNLTNDLVLWESVEWKVNGADFRNWQGVKGSYDAFPHSEEYFVGAGQTAFTLMRPVEQAVAAYITTATPNTATASFSGQPSPGDTITVGPAAGAWQGPSHIYALDGYIIVSGFVFQVTTAGTSGLTEPNFLANTVTGDTVIDNSVIWTCRGTATLGSIITSYEFVSALDNTQFGQILIGATLAETVQNLVDTLNASIPYGGTPATKGRGLTFSLPTWENSQVNAITVTGTGFTVTQKIPGSGNVAALSSTGTAFAWSAANTSGGTSPQTGVGPGEPAWFSIAVYAEGTSTTAPGLSYIQGSAVVNLATPLNTGTNLVVEYTRTDGNVIEVADDASIAALAAISHGTGRIMQMTDQSTLGLISTSAAALLQLAQQILAAYGVAPTSFNFKMYKPGLSPGQTLTAALASPQTPAWLVALLNGNWVIESMEAQFLIRPRTPTGLYGHYKYTVKTVNIQEIASTLDFWERMGGGGTSGGGGAGAALVATSGGTNPSTPASYTFSKFTQSWTAQTSVTVTHNIGTTQVLVQVFDGSGNVVTPETVTITSANVVTLGFGAAFTGSVLVIG